MCCGNQPVVLVASNLPFTSSSVLTEFKNSSFRSRLCVPWAKLTDLQDVILKEKFFRSVIPCFCRALMTESDVSYWMVNVAGVWCEPVLFRAVLSEV